MKGVKEMEKNRMYQLYELRDEMKKALSNLSAVEESERALADIIAKSEKAEEFEDFCKGLAHNWTGYAADRDTMSGRLAKIEGLIRLYEEKNESSELVASVVTALLEGIGATKDEPEEPQEA